MRGLASIFLITWTAQVAASSCAQPFDTQLAPEAYGDVVTALRWMAGRVVRPSAERDVEYGGALLRDADGAIRVSWGAGCPRRDEVSFRIPKMPGSRLVGLWHTHGAAGYARSFFSESDAAVVKRFGLPFYLIDAGGELRVLSPENLPRTRIRRQRGSLVVPRGYSGELAARAGLAWR